MLLYMWSLIYSQKDLTSMVILKYDDVIKKSREFDNCVGIFGKLLRSTTRMERFIAAIIFIMY